MALPESDTQEGSVWRDSLTGPFPVNPENAKEKQGKTDEEDIAITLDGRSCSRPDRQRGLGN
jgi:hypothetical protein